MSQNVHKSSELAAVRAHSHPLLVEEALQQHAPLLRRRQFRRRDLQRVLECRLRGLQRLERADRALGLLRRHVARGRLGELADALELVDEVVGDEERGADDAGVAAQ